MLGGINISQEIFPFAGSLPKMSIEFYNFSLTGTMFSFFWAVITMLILLSIIKSSWYCCSHLPDVSWSSSYPLRNFFSASEMGTKQIWHFTDPGTKIIYWSSTASQNLWWERTITSSRMIFLWNKIIAMHNSVPEYRFGTLHLLSAFQIVSVSFPSVIKVWYLWLTPT